jgi:hypothetical protein
MRTLGVLRAALAAFLAALLPASGFCAEIRGSGPAAVSINASAPVSIPRLSLPAASLGVPALPSGSLSLPSASLPAAAVPGAAAAGAAAPLAPAAAPAAASVPPSHAALPAAPAPEGGREISANGGHPPVPVAGVPSAASRPGVDPRGEGFSPRLWSDAEAHGFVRAASAGDGASGQPGAGQPPLPPSSGAPSAPGRTPPPAPPQKPEALSVFSGKVLGFFGTFLMIQLAVESLALAVPQMTDPLKNGFVALAGLASTSYLAYAVGSFLGGRLVQKLGLARVYRAVLGSRTVIWAAVAAIFHAHGGSVPIAPLIALFSLDYFVHSMGRVAERTLQGEWFKDSPAASNKFGTLRDFVEYGTVFTTMATGLVIATLGFGAIIYAAPLMFAAAFGLAMMLRSLPQGLSGPQRKVPMFAGFKRLFRPDMRALFLSRLLINNFVYLLYYVTATAFGVFFAHGNAGMAAAAASALIGLLGMGANGAAVGNALLSRRIEKETAALPEAQRAAAQGSMMARTAARGLSWAALGILGGWLFVSQAAIGTVAGAMIAAAPYVAAFGALAAVVSAARSWRRGELKTWKGALGAGKWAALAGIAAAVLAFKGSVASLAVWPLFALSPALILIGFTGQTALTQLDTLMLDRMPQRTKAYVVGADRTLTNLSYVVNFLVWGLLFQVFGAAAFWGLGVYCTLTAAAYLFLSRRIEKGK